MANTFELIASSTVGSGGAASIDFTSIPSTYTDLCLKLSVRDTNAGAAVNMFIKLNTSTANFTAKGLSGTGSAAQSYNITDGYLGVINGAGSTSSTFSSGELYFPNYAGSTNKSFSNEIVQENNGTTAYAQMQAELWSNTAAINAISLTPTTLFAQYSAAYLYGIKNS
jgi:hypothetical protein